MRTFLRYAAAHLWVAAVLLVSSITADGQDPQGIWQRADLPNVALRQDRWIQPRAYLTYELEPNALRGVLNRAPREFAQAGAGQELVLPMPDGTFARFRIFE